MISILSPATIAAAQQAHISKTLVPLFGGYFHIVSIGVQSGTRFSQQIANVELFEVLIGAKSSVLTPKKPTAPAESDGAA